MHTMWQALASMALPGSVAAGSWQPSSPPPPPQATKAERLGVGMSRRPQAGRQE